MDVDENPPEWEMSKENVQPRKKGRSVATLNACLSARSEAEAAIKLKEQREKYELAIRRYEGEDEMSVWSEYIDWTEQSYPSGSGQLLELIQSFIKTFKNREEYRNDARFIQHWITYAGLVSDTPEIYRYMHSNKIGDRTSLFYTSWASYLEDSGQSKLADEVISKGIAAGAQPVQDLTRWREEFQSRTCRQIFAGKKEANTHEEESGPQRQKLVPLAARKGLVPIDRTTAARPSQRTIMAAIPHAGRTAPQKPLAIYNDENSIEPALVGGKAQYSSVPTSQFHKENTRLAGKWNASSKTGSTGRDPTTPSGFTIHTDAEQPPATPGKTVTLGSHQGLSVKKKSKESDAPTVFLKCELECVKDLPMYNKTKVYAGVSEFSFEELRAIKWRQEQQIKEAQTLRERAQQQRLVELEERAMRAETEKRLLEERVRREMAELKDQMERDLQAKLEAELGKLKLLTPDSSGSSTPGKDDIDSQSDSGVIASCTKRHRTTPDTTRAKRSFTKPAEESLRLNATANDTVNMFSAGLFSGDTMQLTRKQLESHNEAHGANPSSTHTTNQEAPFSVFKEPEPKRSAFIPATKTKPAVPPLASASKQTENKPAAPPLACAGKQTENKPAAPPLASAGKQTENKPSVSFAVFSDEVINTAPAALVVPTPAAAAPFSIFTDDQPSQQVNAPVPAFEVFTDDFPPPVEPSAPEGFQIYTDCDKENTNTAEPSQQRPTKHSESMDCQTDYNMIGKFAEQARAASTPFGAENRQLYDSELAVSEIKPAAPAKEKIVARPSISQPDFAPTQLLSPITEYSESSSSGQSSGSATLPRLAFDSTVHRTRTHSTHSVHSVCSDSDEADQVEVPAKLSIMPTLNAVAELSREYSSSQDGTSGQEELLSRATPVIDTTMYQPPEITECIANTTVFIDPSDPFNEQLQAKLLRKVDIASYDMLETRDELMPKLKIGSRLVIGGFALKITARLGEGGFATVFKASTVDDTSMTGNTLHTTNRSMLSCTASNVPMLSDMSEVCVKAQSPACPWEVYICRELSHRLSNLDDWFERDLGRKVMNVGDVVLYRDGSLLVNELVSFGSLLNLVNTCKTSHIELPEVCVMYITIELLHIVECLHRCRILHGDLKPDNILFYGFSPYNEDIPFSRSCIKLIDFGRGIDLSKFPEGTTFTASNETDGFMCVEMKTGQPWTYQTDLFGLLGCIHPLIWGSYMTVAYTNNRWKINSSKLPRRFGSRLWMDLFDKLLNVPSCDDLPSLEDFRLQFESEFTRRSDDYNTFVTASRNAALQCDC